MKHKISKRRNRLFLGIDTRKLLLLFTSIGLRRPNIHSFVGQLFSVNSKIFHAMFDIMESNQQPTFISFWYLLLS